MNAVQHLPLETQEKIIFEYLGIQKLGGFSIALQKGHGTTPIKLAMINEDESKIASLDKKGILIIWDIETQKQLIERTIRAESQPSGFLAAVVDFVEDLVGLDKASNILRECGFSMDTFRDLMEKNESPELLKPEDFTSHKLGKDPYLLPGGKKGNYQLIASINRNGDHDIHLWNLPYNALEGTLTGFIPAVKHIRVQEENLWVQLENGTVFLVHIDEKLAVERVKENDLRIPDWEIVEQPPLDKALWDKFDMEDPAQVLSYQEIEHYIFLNCGRDGIKLYRKSREEIVASFFPIKAGEYLIVHPRQLYCSTSEGFNLLAFKFGMDKLTPFNQFDMLLNRPHLVFDKIGLLPPGMTDELRKAFDLRWRKTKHGQKFDQDLFDRLKTVSNVVGHIPELRILNRDIIPRSINLEDVKANIATNGQNSVFEIREDEQVYLNLGIEAGYDFEGKGGLKPLTRIFIFVNDVPIGLASKPFGPETPMTAEHSAREGIPFAGPSQTSFSGNISVALSSGINRIQLSVENEDNLESIREHILIYYHAPEGKPKLYLIGLAVQNYDSNDLLNNLEGPQASILNLTAAFLGLKDNPKVKYGDLERVVLFDDEATPEAMQACKEMLMKSGVDDRVIIYFSGHGVLHPLKPKEDELQRLFLGTSKMTEANIAQVGLDPQILETVVDDLPARNRLILIDACFSGERDRDQESLYLMKDMFVDLRRGSGATIITSAHADEEADDGETSTRFGGALMNALNLEKEVISGREMWKPNNPDLVIHVSDLQQNLIENWPAGATHQPAFRAENISNDWQIW